MITLNDICQWDSAHGGKRGEKIVTLLKKLVFASKSKEHIHKKSRVEGMPAEAFLQEMPLNKCKQFIRGLAIGFPAPIPSPLVQEEEGEDKVNYIDVLEVAEVVRTLRESLAGSGVFDAGPNRPPTEEAFCRLLDEALLKQGVSSGHKRSIIIGTFLGLASGYPATGN